MKTSVGDKCVLPGSRQLMWIGLIVLIAGTILGLSGCGGSSGATPNPTPTPTPTPVPTPTPTPNPSPTISTISPSRTKVGGNGFTLTVTGSNFVAASVVQWNGSSRTTTFVSSTQLTAQISASDVASGGKTAVTVAT